MLKKILLVSVVALSSLLSACDNDASVAARNLSTAADNFEINRRIVFYNGITGEYMLSIEGLCSKDDTSEVRKLSITCKVGVGQYKRHMLGLSDNVTYFVEQLDPAPVNVYHYRVTFKPSTIVPNIDYRS